VSITRPDTAYVTLRLRIKEPLRAEIERAAAARGVSMNAEMQRRLEASFTPQPPGDLLDIWSADPSLRFMATFMMKELVHEGRAAAQAAGIPEEPAACWLERSDTYIRATRGVIHALSRTAKR
jgi:hypothetical protein